MLNGVFCADGHADHCNGNADFIDQVFTDYFLQIYWVFRWPGWGWGRACWMNGFELLP